jgi:hypothetical protein
MAMSPLDLVMLALFVVVALVAVGMAFVCALVVRAFRWLP